MARVIVCDDNHIFQSYISLTLIPYELFEEGNHVHAIGAITDMTNHVRNRELAKRTYDSA
jgi:hypothetical protein